MRKFRAFFSLIGRVFVILGKLLLLTVAVFSIYAFIRNFELPTCSHMELTPYVRVQEVTCTQDGLEEATCKCGYIKTRRIAAPGHSFLPWKVVTLATANSEGARNRSCINCDFVEQATIDPRIDNGTLGSAGWIGNDTVIVSVFADSKHGQWSFLGENKAYFQQQLLYKTRSALEWIQRQCAAFDISPNFYYDWLADPNLVYHFAFNNHFTPDGATLEWRIDHWIDSDRLMQKYNAQNIIYLFFYNPGESLRSHALCDLSNYETECVNLLTKPSNLGSGTIAHEILHCFSAPDLYKENSKIPAAYVRYCERSNTNDIMFNSSSIQRRSISLLDAYYLGLADDHPDVEIWGLKKSSFALAATP